MTRMSPALARRRRMTPALVALDSALSRFGWIRTVSAIEVTIPCVQPACAGVTRAWRNWRYAPGLGPGGRKAVGVRVPPPAPSGQSLGPFPRRPAHTEVGHERNKQLVHRFVEIVNERDFGSIDLVATGQMASDARR